MSCQNARGRISDEAGQFGRDVEGRAPAAVVATVEAGVALLWSSCDLISGLWAMRAARGAAGAIEMNSSPKRKPVKRAVDELARRHQEEELDDALSNTFPASDPVSIVQPAPPKPDWD